MRRLAFSLICASLAVAAQSGGGIQVVAQPGTSPLVTFRVVFRAGSALDPPDKPGAAALTAAILSEGGTRALSYKQILDALFPMAASVSSQADKEMITFSGTTHIDNLEPYYKLFSSMLLDPGWRAEDLERLRDDAVNFLRVTLRGNNDEELGKEVLYNAIYAGHPYGRHNSGTATSLGKMTIADLKKFYADHLTSANLILGIAGGYPDGFLDRVRKDFARLPAGSRSRLTLSTPKLIERTQVLIVDKQTRSTAYSFGFPIDVTRAHRDYPALLVAQSYFGQHRNSGGRLYERIRELRGLNYGNYAYLEYFPNGMFQFEPEPNLARRQQIFQVWIRPLEPATAHFGLRLALHELEKLIRDGLTPEDFERSRSFLSKYVNLLTKTKRAELGYAIDSVFYGTPDYNSHIKKSLASLTGDQVNRAIRTHLRADRMYIVAVADKGEELRGKLLSDAPSPMTYNSPKPKEVLEEDRIVESRKLGLRPEQVKVIPVSTVFE